VRLACREGNEAAATEYLRDLCQAPPFGPEPYHDAIDELLDRGWRDLVDRELAAQVALPNASPQLAAIWIEWCGSHNRFDRCLEALDAFRSRPEAWYPAAESYLGELADAGQAAAVQAFIDRHRDDLRAALRTWAAAGAALAQVGRAPQAVAWLADWRERTGVWPYMLVSLVGALWETGREEEAAEVGIAALQSPYDDPAKVVHQLWVALHAALGGDVRTAARLLAPVSPDLIPTEFYGALLAATRALVELQLRSDQRGNDLTYSVAQQLFQAALAPFNDLLSTRQSGHKLLRRLVFVCQACLASRFGKRLTAAWYRLRATYA